MPSHPVCGHIHQFVLLCIRAASHTCVFWLCTSVHTQRAPTHVIIPTLHVLVEMFGWGESSKSTAPSVDSLLAENRCVMFSMPSCPWCVKAEDLLKSNKLRCKVDNLSESQFLAFEVIKKSSQRSVPNLFIDGEHLGGYEGLSEAIKRCKSTKDERICNFFNGKKRL